MSCGLDFDVTPAASSAHGFFEELNFSGDAAPKVAARFAPPAGSNQDGQPALPAKPSQQTSNLGPTRQEVQAQFDDLGSVGLRGSFHLGDGFGSLSRGDYGAYTILAEYARFRSPGRNMSRVFAGKVGSRDYLRSPLSTALLRVVRRRCLPAGGTEGVKQGTVAAKRVRSGGCELRFARLLINSN